MTLTCEKEDSVEYLDKKYSVGKRNLVLRQLLYLVLKGYVTEAFNTSNDGNIITIEW